MHWLDEPEGVSLLKEAIELLVDPKQMRAMFPDGPAVGAPWWRYVPDGADPAGSMATIRAAQDKAWHASKRKPTPPTHRAEVIDLRAARARLQRQAEKRDGGADRRPGEDT